MFKSYNRVINQSMNIYKKKIKVDIRYYNENSISEFIYFRKTVVIHKI